MTEQYQILKDSLEHLIEVLKENKTNYLSYQTDKEYWTGRADECDRMIDEIRHSLSQAERFHAE